MTAKASKKAAQVPVTPVEDTEPLPPIGRPIQQVEERWDDWQARLAEYTKARDAEIRNGE